MIRRALFCTLSKALQRYCGKFANTTDAYSKTDLRSLPAIPMEQAEDELVSFQSGKQRKLPPGIVVYEDIQLYFQNLSNAERPNRGLEIGTGQRLLFSTLTERIATSGDENGLFLF